jgi:hypothetical protein
MSKTSTSTALAFHDTTFQVVDREGEAWLRLPQIGVALGYENQYKVQQVYDRNSAEFTDQMTDVVELQTAGGVQKVRIFSLRGAHLLGMFSRTVRAAEFRRWVLDILEGIIVPMETGRVTVSQRLAYLKERRSLVRELGGCREEGSAKDLYSNLVQVSRLLGLSPQPLEALAPGIKQLPLIPGAA